MSKKSKAFQLFGEGKRPSDPEVKAIGLKPKTTYNYYQEWKKSGEGTKAQVVQVEAPRQAMTVTKNPAEAAMVTIAPKTFTMSSAVFWMAMDAVKREWGWPKDMPPQEFLDYYLIETLKDYGIILGGYVVLPPDDETDDESEN